MISFRECNVMDSIKLDPQLGLALNTTDAQREKNLELNIGYDAASRQWELLVQYIGNLQAVVEALPLSVVYLMGDYAIVTIKESDIPRLLEFPQIAYVEKPRSLVLDWNENQLEDYPQIQPQAELAAAAILGTDMEGIAASCLPAVYREPYNLTGAGTIICIADSGIDYLHPAFLKADKTTRILAIWDQTIEGTPPAGFRLGTLYTEVQINEALTAESATKGPFAAREAALALVPTTDRSGHGTHVAGIAANVAPEASLLIVKLASGRNQDVPKTSELIQAVTFAKRFADNVNMPLSVNLSYGNNYGAHDGTALTERYLDLVASMARVSICVGTGNDGASARHISRQLDGRRKYIEEFTVATYERSLNLQIWKQLADDMEITLVAPNGRRLGPFGDISDREAARRSEGVYTRYFAADTEVGIYQGLPTPYNQSQQIFIAFSPLADYIMSGVWQIEINTGTIANGRVNLWLPVAEATSAATGFLRPTAEATLTIPSSAARVISVAAYNSITDAQVAFSGRGFTVSSETKPDLAAPGVDINSAEPGGGYSLRTGTSMATPFVAGSAALLMQWGIVEGNDPYLYGERLRSWLNRGARRIPGYLTWPNYQLGWGTLCVRNSIFG